MKNIIVLGSGCKKCVKTAELIQKVADENQIAINLKKETSPEIIMNYGVMSTPSVVLDNQVVHSGSVPDRSEIEAWIKD